MQVPIAGSLAQNEKPGCVGRPGSSLIVSISIIAGGGKWSARIMQPLANSQLTPANRDRCIVQNDGRTPKECGRPVGVRGYWLVTVTATEAL